MKTKALFLFATIIFMATFGGCKKTNCCVLPEDGNTIIALKNNTEWRTSGYLHQYNSGRDTVLVSGRNGQETLNIAIRRSGNGYTIIYATLFITTGDMILADYTLDPAKNSSLSTTTDNGEILEGKFDLYFKINHPNAGASYPSALTFTNGLFSIRWDHIPQVVLP